VPKENIAIFFITNDGKSLAADLLIAIRGFAACDPSCAVC